MLAMILQFHSTAQILISDPPPLAIEKFGQVYMIVSQAYVDAVPDDDLFDNAIKGMMTGLDPHSDYLTDDQVQQLQTTSEGNYGGLGLEVYADKGLIRITTVFDSTPAESAGLLSGDYIVAIDQQLTKDIGVSESIHLMRGEPGTSVNLTVLRSGKKDPIILDVFREVIAIDEVKTDFFIDDIGYLKVSVFNENTASEIKRAVRILNQGNKLKGLIVDLRNNPGGVLGSVVDSSDLFLDADNLGLDKKIIYTKGRIPQSQLVYHATSGEMLPGIPIVVIINEGSASASEIFAAALQDHERAVVIGNKSFGKGSVQTVLPLADNSLVKITTALYFTPKGVSIQANGVVPDIIIPYKKMNAYEEEQENWMSELSEASLPDHLVNRYLPAEDKEAGDTEELRSRKNALAENDFQLYQAIVLLQGMQL